MKTAGEVFRQLKEVKFRHWLVLYKNLSRKTPTNCKFNYRHTLLDSLNRSVSMGLCLLHQDKLSTENKIYANLIDICHFDNDCHNCDAFIQRYTRDEIKDFFIAELQTKQIKEKKYPDICALEWVLDRFNEGYPPISWLQALYYRIKIKLLKIKL